MSFATCTSQHIKALQIEEFHKAAELKATGQSCSSCSFFSRIRLTDICSLKHKPIAPYNICHKHLAKGEV